MGKLAKLSVMVGILLLIAGCSDKANQTGSAATIGNRVIKQKIVNEQLAEILNDLPENSSQQPAPDAGTIGQLVVSRLVISDLVNEALVKLDTKVTDAEVISLRDQIFLQYGQDAVIQQLATTQGVPKSQIDSFFKTILGQGYVGSALAPKGTQKQRSVAAANYLTQLAASEGVNVSPRYGTWDPQQMQAMGLDNSLSFSLSTTQ